MTLLGCLLTADAPQLSQALQLRRLPLADLQTSRKHSKTCLSWPVQACCVPILSACACTVPQRLLMQQTLQHIVRIAADSGVGKMCIKHCLA